MLPLELQSLASRIGAFPVAGAAVAGLEYAEPTAKTLASANYRPLGRDDWREAASDIEDELEDLFDERATSH